MKGSSLNFLNSSREYPSKISKSDLQSWYLRIKKSQRNFFIRKYKENIFYFCVLVEVVLHIEAELLKISIEGYFPGFEIFNLDAKKFRLKNKLIITRIWNLFISFPEAF